MRPGVGLFAKPAVPGEVKTRLCPPLSPERAAALYAAFLGDSAEMLDRQPTWDWWVFSTDVDAQQMSWPVDAPQPHAWRPQEGADLGARMLHAMRALLENAHTCAVLVGSDHPTLPAERIRQAIAQCAERDVVLGPSLDGGYYLVASSRPIPELFHDMPWSTPDVFRLTLERIAKHNLRAGFLDPWYDVDRPADLQLLRNHLTALELERGASAPCPRTRVVLAADR